MAKVRLWLLVQEEYSREEIPWQDIAFNDNQPCLDLIAAKPHGILRILDDQSCFPQVRNVQPCDICHLHGLKEDWTKRCALLFARQQTILFSKSVTITMATICCIRSQRCPSQSSPSSTSLVASPIRYFDKRSWYQVIKVK